MARHVLLSCLGTNDYVPVYYQFGDLPRTEHPQRYVQVAIAQGTGNTFTHAIILLTEKARQKHFKELNKELQKSIPEVVPVDIEEGRSLDELWAIFQKLGDQLQDDDRVVMDLTHGFRSLPATLLLALQFFTHVKKLSIGGLYYGAFEALGTLSEVKARNETNPDANVAPIFDLSGMFVLPAWSAAVATWRATGRAEEIVRLVQQHTSVLRKELRQHAPQSLVGLPDRLSLLDDALALLRHDQIALKTSDVLCQLDAAMQEAEAQVALTPFRVLTTHLRESVEPLAVEGPSSWQRAEDGYLRQQARVAQWYADRGRLMEAFSFLRELINSCAVRVALNAGCSSIVVRKRHEVKAVEADEEAFRSKVDWMMREISDNKGGGERMDSDDREVWEKMKAWCDARPAIARADHQARDKTEKLRNKLDHCWTGREHSQEGFQKNTREKIREKFKEAHAAVTALVDAVTRAEAVLTPDDSKRIGAPRAGGFVNLSNHPASTWSEAQREAARVLGHGEVVELPRPMPLIDPEMDTPEIVRIADALADEVARMGASGAFVATEFVASYALVRALHARGIRCYSTTTARETIEERVDDVTRKMSVFRFVRWRAYPQ